MTRQDYQVTGLVMDIHQIPLHGNITPLPWFHHIIHKNGKPNLVAITILSDIVYWYRPTEVRNEETGQFIGWRSKFRGDMLQRSYKQLSERFGITRVQAKNAVDSLIEIDVLYREFRTIEQQGAIYNNVMFLAPIAAGIRKISESGDENQTPPHIYMPPSPHTNEEAPHIDMNTNTNTSTNTPSLPSQSSDETKPDQPPLQTRPAKGKGWMEELNQPQRDALEYLRRCGVKADHHLQAFCQLPLSVIEREWGIVFNSHKARDKAACLITQLSNLPADSSPPTPKKAGPKMPADPKTLPSWATMSELEQREAEGDHYIAMNAWRHRQAYGGGE